MQSGAMFCQFHHYHIRPVASFYLEGVRHARQDYLSGAPPSVGAERTTKFSALQTPRWPETALPECFKLLYWPVRVFRLQFIP